MRCQASDSSTKYDPRLGTFLVYSSTTPRIIDEVEAEVETLRRTCLGLPDGIITRLGRSVSRWGFQDLIRATLTR